MSVTQTNIFLLRVNRRVERRLAAMTDITVTPLTLNEMVKTFLNASYACRGSVAG
jgi:hypothetical protein